MVQGNLTVNGNTQLGNSSSDTVNVAGSETVQGNLTVNGNTQLGNSSLDTVNVAGSETVQGNLTVNGNTQLGNALTDTVTVAGNATIQGDLTVNGNLNAEIVIDTLTTSGDLTVGGALRVNRGFETISNTLFLGTNNVFNRYVYVGQHLEVVPESDVIGSGSLRAGTLDLAGYLGGQVVPTAALTVGHGHIEMRGAGHGIILTAPNNTRWLLTVDNSGNLTTTPAS
nr:hypothetical protein [Bacillus sp. Xin1]